MPPGLVAGWLPSHQPWLQTACGAARAQHVRRRLLVRRQQQQHALSYVLCGEAHEHAMQCGGAEFRLQHFDELGPVAAVRGRQPRR